MPQIIFEFARIGPIVRVSAIDEDTGTEAIIQGPANAGKATLQRTAMNKLSYLLKKQQETAKTKT